MSISLFISMLQYVFLNVDMCIYIYHKGSFIITLNVFSFSITNLFKIPSWVPINSCLFFCILSFSYSLILSLNQANFDSLITNVIILSSLYRACSFFRQYIHNIVYIIVLTVHLLINYFSLYFPSSICN